MAFSVKDWKDYPDTSTPITAAALEDVETRLSGYTDTRFANAKIVSVLDYGADNTGAASSSTAFTNAIAALPNGGIIIVPPGTYKISTAVTLDSNVAMKVIAHGATFNIDANINGFVIDGDSGTFAPGVEWEGGIVDGVTNTNNHTGFRLKNACHFYAEKVTFRRLAMGVALQTDNSVAAGVGAENNTFVSCVFDTNLFGVATVTNAGGSGLYTGNRFIACNFVSNLSGISLATGDSIQGFKVLSSSFVLTGSSQSGLALSGNCTGLVVQASFTQTTGTSAVQINGSATFVGQAQFELTQTTTALGTIFNINPTAKIDGTNNMTGLVYLYNTRLVMDSGSTTTSTVPFFDARVITDSNARLQIVRAANGANTMGLLFGDGTNTPDTNLFRHSANRLQTSDFFYAASGLATLSKAGAVADADFPSITIVDGATGVDTTNRRMFVRSGGSWYYAQLVPVVAKTPTSVTVTASPFTYQNTNVYDEFIILNGGSVSLLQWSINNVTWYDLGATQTFQLAAGEYLRVTYTTAPTMTKIPRV